MIERRKADDRRVNPPMQGLPFYYTRQIADRRESVQTSWWTNRKDVPRITQPDT
jgi:hypothetical protein